MYKKTGDFILALENYNKSLEIDKTMYGGDSKHPDLAASYSNIGSVYDDIGDYALALQYYNKSLKIKKAIYGSDSNHSDLAISYNNIDLVYKKTGEQKKSHHHL